MTMAGALVLTADDLFVAAEAARGRTAGGALSVEKGLEGFVLYGPYRDLPDGIYEVTVDVAANDADIGTIDVYSHGKVYAISELRSGVPFEARLKDATAVEFRVHSRGKPFVFRSVSIERVADLPDMARLPDRVSLAEARARTLAASASKSEAFKGAWPRGGASAAQVWSSVHSGMDAKALAGFSEGLEPEAIQNWIRETAGATVIEGWGELGVFAERHLAAHGFIPSTVRLMAYEDLALEAAYASMDGDAGLDARLRKAAVGTLGRPIQSPYLAKLSEMQSAFQKPGLAKGAVYCLCPISGELLRSSHAVPAPFDLGKQTFLFYYFQGVEPFYLAVGGWSGAKIFAYFPRRETILRLQDPLYNWGPPQDAVNVLKRLVVSNAALVADYLSGPTKSALLSATIENLGHFFWNDMAGLVKAEREGWLENVKYVVSYKHAFLDPFSILSNAGELTAFKAKTEQELFVQILSNRLFCVRATTLAIDDETAARLRKLASEGVSAETKRHIAEAAKAPYRLWANLRAHNKVLRNQVDAIVRVAEDLARRNGGLALYLDGTPDCGEMADEIAARVPASVKIYRGLDVSMSDSITWAFAVDSYIATIGSGLTLVTWLAKKPGVAHSERAHLAQMEFWGEVRPGAQMPVTPAVSEVNDLGQGGYCDYLIEPSLLVNLMRRATSGDVLPAIAGLKGLKAID